MFKSARIWYTNGKTEKIKGNFMEVYIPSKKTYRRAGGASRYGRSRFDWKWILAGLAALALLVGLVFLIGSCFGGKSVKVTTTQALADSPLVSQLAQAYKEEKGVSLKVEGKTEEEIQALVNEGKADCVLAPFMPDINDTLERGTYQGSAVFYDTYLIVGPKADPARAKHLGQYKAQDVLKHLSLLNQPFIHPAKGTELQTKINAMLQGAGLEVGDWYVEAADDGQQMLQTAKEKNGYTFISRENWALYGEQFPELAVLNQRLVGLVDQYYILAKPGKTQEETSYAETFAQWLKEKKAKSIIEGYKTDENSKTPAFEMNKADEKIENPKEI